MNSYLSDTVIMKTEDSRRTVNNIVRLENSIHLHFFSVDYIHPEFQWRALRTIDGSLSLSKDAFRDESIFAIPGSKWLVLTLVNVIAQMLLRLC